MELNTHELELLSNKDNVFYMNLFNNINNNIKKYFGNINVFPNNSNSYFNFRQTFYLTYFLKDIIKNKHLCHIGCRQGDLELCFSNNTSKITMVEIDSESCKLLENKHSLYKCPIEIINDDFFNITVDADIYFFWCGLEIDILLLEHIKKKYPNKTIISLYTSNYMSNQNSKTYLVPFDERNFKLSYKNISPAGNESKSREESFNRFKSWLNDGLYGYIEVNIIN